MTPQLDNFANAPNPLRPKHPMPQTAHAPNTLRPKRPTPQTTWNQPIYTTREDAKRNCNWRNNSIICDVFIIGSISIGSGGGRAPCLPPGYAYEERTC